MNHVLEIAHFVVHITFTVYTQRISIVGRPVNGHSRSVVVRVRYRRAAQLAQMLPPAGLDETVSRVVYVVGAGFDTLIAEKDGLLRIVLDMRDIAFRVVGIREVLYLASRPSGGRNCGTILRKRCWISARDKLRKAKVHSIVR